MIEIDGVTRRYGDLVAVRDVSVQIGTGQIVGLLGHNGAGKTTLMKMLTGFLEPTSGTLRVGGRDVVDERQEAQRQIGYLPENAPLYPEMLVQDYLLMMAELRGVPSGKRERAVSIAAVRTGLGDHLVKPISTLSKGYRQRVGIAQAIVHEPKLLVLDEPTNGLDPVQIQSIRELIQRLGRQATIILSTHIMQEVEAVCDRVLIMIGGSLVEDAPLSRLLSSNTVHLTLPADTESVRGTLAEVEGVHAVRQLDPSESPEGRITWAIDSDDTTDLVPRVLDAAHDAGWSVSACSPEVRTLDRVFRQLQADHAQRQGRAA
jgi:ABC-2 type transport system ATP-binding protein